MTSDLRIIRDLVALLRAHGIKEAVVSPGSRSAPITNTLFHCSEIRSTVIVDERCAAFFSLGMALRTEEPIALVCTSGSAMLNYGPGLAEAYYRQMPLVVLTADRPKERIDQGEGQSIRQSGALQNVVKGSFDLTFENGDDRVARLNFRLINEAIALATALPKGPVHINIPLREELYEMTNLPLPEVKTMRIRGPQGDLDSLTKEALIERFAQKRKILVLTGMLMPDADLLAQLVRLSEDDRVLVMTESTSNLPHPLFVGCTDRLITTFTDREKSAFAPDLIVTVGHSIVSGKIKTLLRTFGNTEHWHIGPEGMVDTFECLTEVVNVSPSRFFAAMKAESSNAGYASYFRSKSQRLDIIQQSFMKTVPFSDLSVFQTLLREIPRGETLELGNSSVVRYAQLFEPRHDITVYSNRGVSGIDGCTSTAAGAAFVSGAPTTLISGDLAFLYDSNALWSVPLSEHLKIIVINNGGGNIFRIIDGPDRYASADSMFVAKHGKRIKPLAEAHGIPCLVAANEQELELSIRQMYSQTGVMILEVLTSDELNPRVLKQYFEHLKTTSNAKQELDNH